MILKTDLKFPLLFQHPFGQQKYGRDSKPRQYYNLFYYLKVLLKMWRLIQLLSKKNVRVAA